jgi:Tfp pilus assembly protein PilV
MSARRTVVQIVAKTGMLIAGVLVFAILLAALPAHRAPAQQQASGQQSSGATPADHDSMPGMDMTDEHANEKAAVHDMTAKACGRAQPAYDNDAEARRMRKTKSERSKSWRNCERESRSTATTMWR